MLYDLHAHRRKGLLFALGRDHHIGFPAANAAERLASRSVRFVLAGIVTATPSPTITKTPRPESRGKTLSVACVSANLRGRR